MTIRVLICDDQAVVRDGLEMILNADHELEVVGLASDGHDALAKATKLQPDLILMDLNMPGMNGIQATEAIHAKFPDMPVLVLTTFGEDEWVFDAIRAGALGYLLKGTTRQEIVRAIKGTIEGRSYIDPAVGSKILKKVEDASSNVHVPIEHDLGKRELEILALLARGFSNAEISGQLNIAQGTVRNYVSSILAKLGVKDRTQAALLAIRNGLVN